ncbi:permease-like cell division protein FtsX [Bermanella sp. WJH001]|uniref:permease-like cell division protein FtsX n=1 Tax=Bermanella sp. WJH001 TaxID=3048005 RepID=UPI0024BF0A11|nr:permease-like cell division protein FtsX [Bermanella sp. WJH001]MDJ1538784.1 permease-like cell division protein FtsX [Bermanella sp. WJH001]
MAKPSAKPANQQSRVTIKSQGSAYFQHHKLMAVDSLKRLLAAPASSLMTWLVLAIALSLPMTLYVSLENVKQLSRNWDQTSQISVYLKKGVLDRFADDMTQDIASWPEVSSAVYIAPDQALKEFSASTGLSDVIFGLGDNPLPGVISVIPRLANQDETTLEQLQLKLEQQRHVDSVQLDLLWVKRLYQFMELGQRLVWALAALLGLAVLLIIGNTIRLSIESRRDEIRVVKLVGGTDAFVRRPFLYTGLWFGLGGGIIAWLLLSMGLFWLSGPVEQLISLYGSDFTLKGLGFVDSFLLILDGVVLGWLGAWLAVSRHLSSIEP